MEQNSDATLEILRDVLVSWIMATLCLLTGLFIQFLEYLMPLGIPNWVIYVVPLIPLVTSLRHTSAQEWTNKGEMFSMILDRVVAGVIGVGMIYAIVEHIVPWTAFLVAFGSVSLLLVGATALLLTRKTE